MNFQCYRSLPITSIIVTNVCLWDKSKAFNSKVLTKVKYNMYVQLFLIFSSCGDEIGKVLPEVGSNKVPPTPATTKKRKIPKSTNETTPQVR